MLYIIRLFPYVFGFLKEQWIRLRSRNWPIADASVVAATVEARSMLYFATLIYKYNANGQECDGSLSRRCLHKSSADELTSDYAAGEHIQIRFDPRKPDNSYASLPIGWLGFVYAFFIVGTGCIAVFGGLAAGLQVRYNETHYKIPVSEWHEMKAGYFTVTMPDAPKVSLGYHDDWRIDGQKPQTIQWTIIRPETYFYLEFLRFTEGTNLAKDGLDQALVALKAEDKRRYVYKDTTIALEGRSGREFQYTRPYNTMRVYVDGSDLYILGTDGFVDSDMQKFFDSFHFSGTNR